MKTKPITKQREQHNPLRNLKINQAVRLVESYPRGEFADLMWTLGAPFVGVEAADADLSAIIGRRADALYEMDWNCKPSTGERFDDKLAEEQAEFLHEIAEGINNIESAIEHLALASCRGFSVVEIVDEGNGKIALEPVDHWNIARDGLAGDWYYNPESRQISAKRLGEEMKIDPTRFIIREVPRPFGRIAIAKFIRTNLAERDWASFTEIYGLPSGVVVMPEGTSEEGRDLFASQAEAIAEAGSGALPFGSEYFANPATTGMTSGPFRDLLDYLTEKLILVGTGGKLTMLAESGSGTLGGNAHMEVWKQLARAEAVRISRLIQQQLFEPLLKQQWPDQKVSAYWELAYREEIGSSGIIDDAVKLNTAGYRMDAEELAEKTGYKLDGVGDAEPEPKPEPKPTDKQDQEPIKEPEPEIESPKPSTKKNRLVKKELSLDTISKFKQTIFDNLFLLSLEAFNPHESKVIPA